MWWLVSQMPRSCRFKPASWPFTFSAQARFRCVRISCVSLGVRAAASSRRISIKPTVVFACLLDHSKIFLKIPFLFYNVLFLTCKGKFQMCNENVNKMGCSCLRIMKDFADLTIPSLLDFVQTTTLFTCEKQAWTDTFRNLSGIFHIKSWNNDW